MVDPLVKIDFNASYKLFGYGNIVWQESAGRRFKSCKGHKKQITLP